MSDTEETTVVIFRKYRSGEVIALFPYLPGNVSDPGTCESFVHVGQHGPANAAGVVDATSPAAPAEYAALKRELENPPYGYQFTVRERMPRDAADVRRAALNRR